MLKFYIDTPDEKEINNAINLFDDSNDAQLQFIKELNDHRISGITTNPTLINKLGISDYPQFIKNLSEKFKDYPISFEVTSDETNEIVEQAKKIQLLCVNKDNCYVKIPIVNTFGHHNYKAIIETIKCGIKVNVTAIFRPEQVAELVQEIIKDKDLMDRLYLLKDTILSIFIGRINDAGVRAIDILEPTIDLLIKYKLRHYFQILWASSRAVMDIYDAIYFNEEGMYTSDPATNSLVDIITITPDLYKKYLTLHRKDLNDFSRETSEMFYWDAKKSGLTL